jgi:putative transposase
VEIACENPDEESERPISQFTIREVADEAVKREIVPSISLTQVWAFLKSGQCEAASKPVLALSEN